MNYKIWGGSKSYTSSPDYEGIVNCTENRDSYSFDSTNGDYCNVVVNVTVKDKGIWNCSVVISDGWASIEKNLTENLTMINSEPVLREDIPNQNISGNESDVFDLDDYFYDADGDSLSFNFTGNDSLVFDIDDGEVGIYIKGDFKGTEDIVIYADDGINFTKSNTFEVSVSGCIANWSCGVWSDCVDGIQTRVCSDMNNCEGNRVENQTCIIGPVCGDGTCGDGEDCNTCPIDCGVCQEEVGFTGAEEGDKEYTTKTDKSKKLMLTGIIFGILIGFIGIILLVNYLMHREKKPAISVEPEVKEERKIKIEKETKKILSEEKKEEIGAIGAVNVNELREYIKKSLASKIPVAKIKEDLLKAGWKEKQVVHEFDIMNLKTYINSKLKQGVRKEDVIEILKSKGWKEEQINEAFKELG
jgi:hypothetical protein